MDDGATGLETTAPPSRGRSFLNLLGRISYARLAIAQGAYFVLTGLWPLFSMSSFLAVTGPKTDLWLVRVVGLLIGVIGSVLVAAGIRWKVTPEIFMLAVGSSLALAGIELYYVATGVISAVYLLDAFLEAVLVSLWIWIRLRGGGSTECGPLIDPTLKGS